MKIEEIKKYIPTLITVLLVILSIFIIKDLILPLVSAFILAFLLKPLYSKLNKYMSKPLSAILCITIATLIIVVPFILIFIAFLREFSIYLNSTFFIDLIKRVSELEIIDWLGVDLADLRSRLTEGTIGFIGDITSYIPGIAISLMILVFSMYYFLISWEKLANSLKAYLPSKDKEKVSKELASVTKAVVYGALLIAAIEFIVGLIGFWIAGFEYALIFATMIALFSFIPALGPMIIWIPAAIILALQGQYIATGWIIIVGLFLSIYVDSILRVQISGKGAKVHPLIMLIGLIGGIATLGIAGFIVGPLILSYTIALLEEIQN